MTVSNGNTNGNNGNTGVGEFFGQLLVALIMGVGLFALGYFGKQAYEQYTANRYRQVVEASLSDYKTAEVSQLIVKQKEKLVCKANPPTFGDEESTVVIEASTLAGSDLLRGYTAISLQAGLKVDIKPFLDEAKKDGGDVTAIIWVCKTFRATLALATIVKARDQLDPVCGVTYYLPNGLGIQRQSTCFPF